MPLDAFRQDVRYAVRSLRRDAGVGVFAILITALGIGASVTVFSVVYTLILRPLPFAEPDRLVWIANHQTSGLSGQTTQAGHLLDVRERTQSLSGIAGYFAFYGVGDNLLSGRGEPERLSGVPVSGNFFDVLGVRPEVGRGFSAEESAWNGPKAVVLSHALWERRFAADPAIVGSSLTLNGVPYAVVGVLPASFDFASVFAPGSHFDLFFAFPLSPETNRWGNTMAMIGRLKPGVGVEAAGAEIRALAARITAEHPERNSFEGFVTPLAAHVNGSIRQAVWVLAGAVAMVMLIVCANLSNLLLARSAARQKEMAIRTALGAGRRRLLAQAMTEGMLISWGGAGLGLLLAVAGTRTLSRLDAISVPLLRDVRIDTAALGFAVVVAIAAGVDLRAGAGAACDRREDDRRVEGCHPGIDRGPAAGLGEERAGGGGDRVRVRAAGRCRTSGAQPGPRARDRYGFPRRAGGHDSRRSRAARRVPRAARRLSEWVLRRVKEVPGVTSAGITDALPLGRNRTWGARAKGVTYERGRGPTAFVRMVSDGYLGAMGIPLRGGRDIAPADTSTSEPVILVNENMARTLWPGQDPIGRYVLGGAAPD